MDEYKGYNGTLVLTPTGIVIKRGLKGFLLGGLTIRGDKTIPFKSIVAVQMKKAGLTVGYIQFTLTGGSEAKKGLFESVYDENTVNFYQNQNKKFEEAKSIIEGKINNQGASAFDVSDELVKLAKLKDKGILTEKEFVQRKKLLLQK